MAMQHDKQFKLDAIRYYQDHKDLGVRGCAENLGIQLQPCSLFRTFGRYILLFFCLQTMRHMKFFFRSRGIFSFSYTELLFISVSTVHKLLIGRLTSFYECF